MLKLVTASEIELSIICHKVTLHVDAFRRRTLLSAASIRTPEVNRAENKRANPGGREGTGGGRESSYNASAILHLSDCTSTKFVIFEEDTCVRRPARANVQPVVQPFVQPAAQLGQKPRFSQHS